jgi:hypothetical protein
MINVKDGLKPKGKVELFVTKGRPVIIPGKLLSNYNGHKVYDSHTIDFSAVELLRSEEKMNIILNQGKDAVIACLTNGFVKVIARMAVGDRGALPSDQTVPKVPVATQTGLFNEVYRKDIDVTSLNIGTPTVHQVQFVSTFDALSIPITSFSNQANPIVNEVGLVMADLLSGNPLPRAAVAAPSIPDADETVFSLRTFKSVPFEAANEISVTIRYTIFIE